MPRASASPSPAPSARPSPGTASSGSFARSGRRSAREAPAGRDYVLAARPGLAEAVATRDHDWLVEQVREVIGKVQA